jgi:hypothetical protein
VKRAAFIALLFSLAAGCASLFHKPRPDLELAVEQRPWRVRCGWVLPPAGEPGAMPGAMPGPRADGWGAGDDEARNQPAD